MYCVWGVRGGGVQRVEREKLLFGVQSFHGWYFGSDFAN